MKPAGLKSMKGKSGSRDTEHIFYISVFMLIDYSLTPPALQCVIRALPSEEINCPLRATAMELRRHCCSSQSQAAQCQLPLIPAYYETKQMRREQKANSNSQGHISKLVPWIIISQIPVPIEVGLFPKKGILASLPDNRYSGKGTSSSWLFLSSYRDLKGKLSKWDDLGTFWLQGTGVHSSQLE